MKNKSATIRVAKKSDRPSSFKTGVASKVGKSAGKVGVAKGISKMIPMMKKAKMKMGERMGGKKQVVPNLTAMKKRSIISSMD